ncbi:MAG TPA: lamin tail domain-containing protein [Blastocatellia bacterium]|nr:lamin tail domain-containing protein [Blastocatellia bacterium]
MTPPKVQGLSPGLVISQVYGGGGNSGATYTHDFIELFNRGTAPIDVSGWSVQYASATGATWQVTALSNITIQPGQYYLVQEAQGAGGTSPLPAPDAIGTIAMAAGAGKVALVNSTAALTGCPSGNSVIDLVGYGTTATCFETGPTANLSNTTAAVRGSNGCLESDNNSGDLTVGTPSPHNTSSPIGVCGAPTNPTGTGAANPNPILPGGSTLLTVTVTPGANPASSGIFVTGDLSTVGGSTAQTFYDDGTNGDATTSDNIFSVLITAPAGTDPGLKTLPITITDAQSRSGSTSVQFTVQAPQLVVISQIYGGGGNDGSTYKNDFIEIFNRGTSAVDLTGWSVQFIAATGTGTWQVTPLTGTIAPGHYYLIQEAAGAGGTVDLPAPDAVGTIAVGSTAGKVALLNTTTALSGSGCPFGAGVVDFVGYGAANCSESNVAAPTLSNTTSAIRARLGCRDLNRNSVDFSAGQPRPRNSASPVKDCSIAPPQLAIHTIQGPGLASPYVDQEVITTGIVTGLKTNGFFLQAPAAEVDDDSNTSEGIFVFTGGSPSVAVGDLASALGIVTEFFGLTQVSSSNLDVTVTSSLNPLPEPVTLTTSILNPAGGLNQLERFEGMRMHADSLVSTAPTNDFGEIFTVLPGVPRPLREPGIEISSPLLPGSPCCIPRFDENPERLMVDSDGRLGSTRLEVTSSVTLSNVTGPLDYAFGNYKVLPDTTPAVTPNLTAIPVPVATGNEFTIGSANLLNFFSTNANFTDRLNKASMAIRNVMRSPDIIGLEEIGDLETLTALADQLNSDSGASNPGYQAYLLEGDDSFPNDIDVGLLIKSSRVNVVSITQEGKGVRFTDPTDGSQDVLFERPPLVLRATIPAPGGSLFPVTVVVNHPQSLIDVEDPLRGPRQREKRRLQAEFTANLAQSLQSENLILVGDFNAFQFNDGYVDTIGTIKGTPTPADQVLLASPDLVNPNLTDLVDLLPADQRYSFNFDGTLQVLDHVLVSAKMMGRFSRFAYARNNSDFPESFGTDGTRPERISDHDLPVAFFTFPPPAADLSLKLSDSPDQVPAGGTITYTIAVTNHGTDRASNVLLVETLPIETTFVSCTASGGGVCHGIGNLRTVSFASIGIGATETVTITAAVKRSVHDGTHLLSLAAVGSSITDPILINNLAAATTIVRKSSRP